MRAIDTRLALLLAIVPLIQACSEGTAPRLTEIRVEPASAAFESLGTMIQFSARLLDGRGQPMDGESVAWSSSDPEVVSVAPDGRATAHRPGAVEIRASAQDMSGTATAIVEQVPAEVRRIAGDGQSQVVDEAVAVDPEVEILDGAGHPIVESSVAFTVTSGGGRADPTEVITDSQGRASTRWVLGVSTQEEQRLRAQAGPVAATFGAEALPGAASALVVADGDGQWGRPGTTLPDPLRARVVDPFANPVPGITVAFSTNGGVLSATSAVSNAQGLASVQLTLPGSERQVVVTASAAGLAPVEFTLLSADVALSVVTPDVPEGRATLPYDGRTFEAVGGSGAGYGWSVGSGSLPAGLNLSPTGVLQGVPTTPGDFSFGIQVTDDQGNTATRVYSLRICSAPLALAPGETWAGVPAAPGACGTFLPSGGVGDRYRVAVLRPTSSTSPNDVASVMLRVTGVGGVTAAPVAPVVAQAQPFGGFAGQPDFRAGVASRLDPAALELEERTAEFHGRLRMSEQRMLDRLLTDHGAALDVLPDRSAGPALRRGSETTGGPALPRALQTGGNAPERRIIDPSTDQQCTVGEQRVAHLLDQNEIMAVYQDSIQRETTPVSVELARRMLDYYEAHGQEVIDEYFGGVPDVNGDGQVVVFISPVVGQNTAAFVWSGDFLPKSTCPASNEMELVFFSAGVINSMASGNHQALATLVHEVKHVSSLYNRLRRSTQMNSAQYHPVWVEEGTAEIAAERSSRLAWARTGGPSPTEAVQAGHFQGGFTRENYGVVIRLARTVTYLSSHPNMVTNDPVGAAPGHSFYGSSWHFHRWLGDARFPPSGVNEEALFFRAQNDSTTRPGVQGIQDIVGTPFAELMEEYAGAIMANGVLTGAGAQAFGPRFRTYVFPSATEIFSSPNPPGVYPWPVTQTGSEDAEVIPHRGFDSRDYPGPLAPSGIRVHDFLSNGSGQGMELHLEAGQAAVRLVVVRLR